MYLIIIQMMKEIQTSFETFAKEKQVNENAERN